MNLTPDEIHKTTELLNTMEHQLDRLRDILKPDPAPALVDTGNPMYDPPANTIVYPDPESTRDPLLVAIVVGHEPMKPGACNAAAGTCEFPFNDDIADRILGRQPAGVRFIKVHRHPGSYSQLPHKINELSPDLVLSLHANASHEGRASGTEMLYASGSSLGRQFAEMLQTRVLEALQLSDRGTKSRTRRDRGGTLLFGCRAPAVIAEPFFIDHDDDLARAESRIDKLVDAYVHAIIAYKQARQR